MQEAQRFRPYSLEDTRRRLKDACLLDDDYMTAYFTQADECVAELLRVLLPDLTLELDSVETQRSYSNVYGRTAPVN